MFVLAVVVDTIRTMPQDFNRDSTEVLIEQIEIKFSNKILTDVGLCISFYDFVDVGDPYVYPAEGAAHQRIKFRMVVFRPFIGEIIVGRLLSSNKDGIRVTLDFFDDIFVPSYLLQSPSEFNVSKGVWVWKYDLETGEEFLLEGGEEIRLRVRTVNFTKVTSSGKGLQATITSETKAPAPVLMDALHKTSNIEEDNNNNTTTTGLSNPVRRRSSSIGLNETDEVPSAMQLICSMNEDGLGLTSWWS